MLPGVLAIHGGETPCPEAAVASRPGEPRQSHLVWGAEYAQLADVFEDALAALLSGAPPRYNPLVLIGPTGTGKTQLVRNVCDALRPCCGKWGAQYVRAAEYAQELVDAIEADDAGAWRARHRGARLLVIDDIEHLSGKERAQEELARTIDALLAEQRQVVVIAHAFPGSESDLLPVLQARLTAGLILRMPLPESSTRQEIVRQFARARGVMIDDDAAVSMANRMAETAVALGGAVTYLHAVTAGKIDVAAVAAYLHGRSTPRAITIADIAGAAARHFALSAAVICGASRQRTVVAARGAAMLLARRIIGATYEQIGAHFGGRDHTTVLHACRRMESLVETDQATRHAIDCIEAALQRAG